MINVMRTIPPKKKKVTPYKDKEKVKAKEEEFLEETSFDQKGSKEREASEKKLDCYACGYDHLVRHCKISDNICKDEWVFNTKKVIVVKQDEIVC